MGRRRSSSSAGHHPRHLDDAARHVLADHVDGLEVLARVREDRLGLVQRPRGERDVLGGHDRPPVEAHLGDGVDEAGRVGDVGLRARAQLAGIGIDDTHPAAIVAEVTGRPVQHDVAAGVAGGEERRLGRRLQRRPHDPLRQTRDLRNAVHAASAALQRIECALKGEPHADVGQGLENRVLQPLDVGRAEHVPAQPRPDGVDPCRRLSHRSSCARPMHRGGPTAWFAPRLALPPKGFDAPRRRLRRPLVPAGPRTPKGRRGAPRLAAPR